MNPVNTEKNRKAASEKGPVSRVVDERKEIANFFLDIYKTQNHLPTSTPGDIVSLESENRGKESIFELRIHHGKKWETRRMSVEMIGENPDKSKGNKNPTKTKGSKSKCFTVTYDNLLVVKIPPTPIRSFDEYLQSLRTETRIAERLLPDIEFVAPGVSALCRKIHPLPYADDLSPSEQEEHYIEWLRKKPSYQNYLKINGAFAFFMDLSRHTFLSHIVEKIHDPEEIHAEVNKDILNSHNLLWDILEFENRYGDDQISACLDLQRIYSEYESKLTPILKAQDLFASVTTYEKQEWFLLHLAGKEIKKGRFSEDFIQGLEGLLDDLLSEYHDEILAYRNVVMEYVRGFTFTRNKHQMAGISANLINLLALLEERGIAIRDLKPDNLFVVADWEKNPHFLESPEHSSLGLIDFETAVTFDETDDEIQQPLLAGTPAYATPSHLFPNGLLIKTLGNQLPRIFRLQDWQAILAMIFTIITGDYLYDRTRKLLFHTKSTIRKSTMENRPLWEGFIKASQMFWKSGAAEFQKKLSDKEEALKSVRVDIPPAGLSMLKKETINELRRVQQEFRNYISRQTLFASEKNRKNLLRFPANELMKYRIRWEKGENTPRIPPQIRVQTIRLLKNLEEMRRLIETLARFSRSIEEENSEFTSYQILEVMFAIVFRTMYREQWEESVEEEESISEADASDLNEDTLLFEATV